MTVPAGIDRVAIRRKSLTMPSLGTLDSVGRPADWTPAVTADEDWGHLRVFCSGVDVTFFRDKLTEIRDYGYLEPFGYGPATIAFPQISPFDTLGAGELAWFVQGMNVELKREDPVTGVIDPDPVWEGLADPWTPENDEDPGYAFVVNCIGALQQAQHEPMPPSFDGDLVDAGAALKEAFDGVPSRRYATFPTVVTTRGTRNRGSWQARYDYAQEILSTLYNADGTRQWTIGCDPGRIPTLHQKDLTTIHWHISVGTPGVRLSLRSDIGSAPNVIYGEWISPDGGRGRNSRYPDSNPPVFVPLAYVSENMPVTYDSHGNPTVNPSFDPARLRVARYENFGSGVTRDEAIAWALGELTRDVNPGWYGDITLDIDPEELSRRDIRAGQNLGLRHHHGIPVRRFHIAQVKINRAGQAVLTVDTNARDWITLEGLKKRDRDAATDPARRLSPPRRRSRLTPDQRPVFDSESGAGLVPTTMLTGGVWNIIRIPASRYGTINRTVLSCLTPATTFAAGVFSKAVTSSTLDTLVGNPLTEDFGWDANAETLNWDPDDSTTAGLLQAWGDHFKGAGYWPLGDNTTDPVTGKMDDDGPWDFFSDTSPWLWLVVFPADDCTLTGRLYVAPDT